MAEILIRDVYEGYRIPVDTSTITILKARLIEPEVDAAARSTKLRHALAAVEATPTTGHSASDAEGAGGSESSSKASALALAEIIAAEEARIKAEKSGLCFH